MTIRDMKGKKHRILAENTLQARNRFEELSQFYYDTLRDIEMELDTYYRASDIISRKGYLKALTGQDMRSFKKQIEEFLQTDIREEWKRELEKLSSQSRVSRLQSMQVQLRQKIEELGKQEERILLESTRASYENTYYKTLFEVTKEIGTSKVFNMVNFRAIEVIQKQKWAIDNLNISERIWIRQDKVRNQLFYDLKRTVGLGEHPSVVAGEFAEKFNTSRKNAKRLLYSETARFTSEADKEVFEELDVERYQNIATLDNVTSDICVMMDLTIFPLREFDIGVTAPPFHPWCRTVTVPYYDDNIGERWARDGNKTYKVAGDITVKEWREKFVKAS